jgi:hypothetical protein
VFTAWANYYTLLGEASASLIGLLFVVTTLSAGLERGHRAIGARLFMTPTISMFAMVLTLSAIALEPATAERAQRGLVLAIATIGAVYFARVTFHLPRSRTPEPVPRATQFCYGPLPLLIFLGLGASAVLPDTASAARGAGWGTGALLLASVRNAWHLANYMVGRGGARD